VRGGDGHKLLEAYIAAGEEARDRGVTQRDRLGGRRMVARGNARWNAWFGKDAASGKAVRS
jgi:hypothetical protein